MVVDVESIIMVVLVDVAWYVEVDEVVVVY